MNAKVLQFECEEKINDYLINNNWKLERVLDYKLYVKYWRDVYYLCDNLSEAIRCQELMEVSDGVIE